MPAPIQRLAPLYGSVIELCSVHRTVAEVHAYAADQGVSLAPSAVNVTLRRWYEAGAVSVKQMRTGAFTKPPHGYRATKRALEPRTMVQALGLTGARLAADSLGIELPELAPVVAAPAPPALTPSAALVPAPGVIHTAELRHEPTEPLPPAYEAPADPASFGIFGATATFGGLLIPWDQVPRLAELMQLMGER